MVDVDETIKDLIDKSERVEIKTVARSISGDSPLIRDNLSFAEPGDILLLSNYLGFSKEDLSKDDNIDTMRILYVMAQKSEEPLYSFLLKIGNEIGGRMNPGFHDKLRTYLRLLLENESAKNAARILMGKDKLLKEEKSEINDILKSLKKELRS